MAAPVSVSSALLPALIVEDHRAVSGWYDTSLKRTASAQSLSQTPKRAATSYGWFQVCRPRNPPFDEVGGHLLREDEFAVKLS